MMEVVKLESLNDLYRKYTKVLQLFLKRPPKNSQNFIFMEFSNNLFSLQFFLLNIYLDLYI